MKPIHPIVRLNVAQMLHDEYGIASGEAAVAAANTLIKHLRDRRMDIVVGDWMAGEREKFDWNDLAAVAAEWEERKPWNPVELA